VASINSKLDKGTGFIAGAAFVFSLMGAVFGVLASTVFKKFTGG
jgi:cytochrome c biogenesis protein CcdA